MGTSFFEKVITRKTPPFFIGGLISVFFLSLTIVGCGSANSTSSSKPDFDNDCADCPNSKIANPQIGPEETLNPQFSSWHFYPVETTIVFKTIDLKKSNGETYISISLKDKNSDHVILFKKEWSGVPNKSEPTETKELKIPAAILKVGFGNKTQSIGSSSETSVKYLVSGKTIDVFLEYANGISTNGTYHLESWVSPNIPGLLARKEIRDENGKTVSITEMVEFKIP